MRPWLGVVGLSLNADIARYYDLPVAQGVIITRVAEGSPAEAAGLASGDIILEVDNTETRTIEDLIRIIRSRRVGDVIRIFALRDSRQHFFELKLSSAP